MFVCFLFFKSRILSFFFLKIKKFIFLFFCCVLSFCVCAFFLSGLFTVFTSNVFFDSSKILLYLSKIDMYSNFSLDNFYFIFDLQFFFLVIFLSIFKILAIFISVAFFTLAERKLLGAMHRRRGPSLVGVWGLLQPISDAVKLFLKELIYPRTSNSFLFLLAPCWILVLSVFSWYFIPFHIFLGGATVWFQQQPVLFSFVKYSGFKAVVLFILALSSLNVYGIILSGWSSNSKYAFLGGLRSAAQMISYEVSFGLSILPVILLTSSFDLTQVTSIQKESSFFLFSVLPCFFIFLVSMLAETNRTPFDLPEAEAELVAGYNVEYSAITFALFFLGEYSSMILMATMASILFFGGFGVFYHVFFPLKILFFCFFFVWVRGTLPRFRYDQLMQLCWKSFLPITLGFFIFSSSLFFFFIRLFFDF